MRLKKRPTPEEEAAFIAGAKADQAENPAPPAAAISSPEPATTPITSAEAPSPAVEEQSETPATDVDPHQFVRRTEWPILPSLDPYMAEGRDDLDKPFVMRMKENLWCSIDRHCKALGVDKSKWIRQAILNQMAAEQQHFIEKNSKA